MSQLTIARTFLVCASCVSQDIVYHVIHVTKHIWYHKKYSTHQSREFRPKLSYSYVSVLLYIKILLEFIIVQKSSLLYIKCWRNRWDTLKNCWKDYLVLQSSFYLQVFQATDLSVPIENYVAVLARQNPFPNLTKSLRIH